MSVCVHILSQPGSFYWERDWGHLKEHVNSEKDFESKTLLSAEDLISPKAI